METRGWRREEKELEHNDLDTGTFFNTSDWPANKHILAVNTHMHTHRKHTHSLLKASLGPKKFKNVHRA